MGAESGRDPTALFAAQVVARPGAVALVHNGVELSYAELDARADQLAARVAEAWLESTGAPIVSGSVVGLRARRGIPAVTALLAISRLGAAYLPLDPDYPADRLAYMVDDAEAPLVLCDGPGLVPGAAVLDLAEEPRTRPPVTARPAGDPGRLAYIMYTSGSTGRPKGVRVGWPGILRLARNNGFMPLEPGCRIAHASSISFDAATFEVWAALLNGGTLVILDPETLLDPDSLARAIAALDIGAMFMTTALFGRHVIARPQTFAGLEWLLFGGEAADPEVVRRLMALPPADRPSHLVNCYGPTENTTFSTTHPIEESPAPDEDVPIGRFIAGTDGLVVDRFGRRVPAGTAGELLLSGSGVAFGYHNRPDLTAARFIPAAEVGAGPAEGMFYRTGDLVTMDEDGLIRFVGRVDDGQIKLRGHRIELGEIEAELRACPGVRLAHAVVIGDEAATRFLRAVYVGETEATPEAVRAEIERRLPGYMVPAQIVAVTEIPVTTNGKVDTVRLRTLDFQAEETLQAYGQDALVDRCRAIVAEMLGLALEAVPGSANFVALGGNSLTASMCCVRMAALGLRITPRELLQLDAIAQLVEMPLTPLPAETPLPAGARRGLSAQQRGLIVRQMQFPELTCYNIPVRLHVPQTLAPRRLEQALRVLVERHPALRTAFWLTADGFVREVMAEFDFALAVEPDEALALLEMVRPFDLASPPLLRAVCVPRNDDSTVLLLDFHHLAIDGSSLDILLEDLDLLLRFRPLPPCGADYGELVRWQERDYAMGQRARDAAFWVSALAGTAAAPAPGGPAETVADFDMGVERAILPTAEVRATAAALGVTPFAAFLTALHLALARRNRSWSQCVGVPVACRDDPRLARTVGMFVNTVCAIGVYRPTARLGEAIAATAERWAAAADHQNYPIDEVRVSGAARGGELPFEVMLAYQNLAFLDRRAMGGTARIAVEAKRHCELPLTLHAFEGRDSFDLQAEYQCRRYQPAEVAALLADLRDLLAAMPERLDASVAELIPWASRQPAALRRDLVDFNFA